MQELFAPVDEVMGDEETLNKAEIRAEEESKAVSESDKKVADGKSDSEIDEAEFHDA